MKLFTVMLSAVCLLGGIAGLRADTPGQHPYYLHALSDLRAAKWNIEHRPGDFQVSVDEVKAAGEIKAVIDDIKKAAIDDGKDLNDHPAADETLDYHAHLHRALDLLKKTHGDISHEEDDKAAKGLKKRSLKHLDKAIQLVGKAIKAAEKK